MNSRNIASQLLGALAFTGAAVAQVLEVHEFPGGGWGTFQAPREHISEAEQQGLWQTIQGNIAALRAQGRLPELKADFQVRFAWPTRPAPGRPELHDHETGNYIDHDPAAKSVLDFNCGTRTYETTSGGHNGTDIGVAHRAYYKMDTEQVVVVAAAPGTIVAKDGSQPDRSCGDLNALFANPALKNNEVSIRHADGSLAHYFHFKTGSLTAKEVGDQVAEGEYLGVLGASGFSASPHLHFEVRSATNAVIDPWAGACNPTTTVSLWKAQEPYYDQVIMDLMASSTAPTPANMSTTCINNVAESKPASGYLQPDFYAQPGVQHSYIAFMRDIQAGNQVVLALKRPDGSQYATGPFTATAFGTSIYVFMNRTIPATEPAGTWSFAVTYAGNTRSVPFHFNVPVPAPARVYEFYNSALDHYFRTAAAAEAASLTPASGFLPTAGDFFALDRSVSLPGVSPVCRFYGSPDPGPNSHFYTADPAECAALKGIAAQAPASSPRWNYEEIAFAAYQPVAGVCPVEAPFPIYRLYNRHAGETNAGKREDSNHRFTTLSSVYNQMGLNGWKGEGVVMCAESKP